MAAASDRRRGVSLSVGRQRTSDVFHTSEAERCGRLEQVDWVFLGLFPSCRRVSDAICCRNPTTFTRTTKQETRDSVVSSLL